MKQRYPQLVKHAGLLLVVVASILQPGKALAVPLASEPLFVTGGAEPNILYVMDDSGSMMHELTPDDAFRFSETWSGSGQHPNMMFPMVEQLYGSSDDASVVPTFDDDSVFGARARASQLNLGYYNPSVTYKPWVKHDGTYYPDADPERAYHNPERQGKGFRNLTVENTATSSGDSDNATVVEKWLDCSGTNFSEDCELSDPQEGDEFWPATYFWFVGGDDWDSDNFEGPIELKNATATYTGHGRESRTDCVAGVCTYEQEIQNFANWYTYYRSRILTARASVGQAFVDQGDNMRVGYGTINQGSTTVDNVATRTVMEGVRKFSSDNKEAFFDWLYTYTNNNSGTPLRNALDGAGQYFSRGDEQGPYSATPGEEGDGPDSFLSCRANYTIFMTDGYWSGGGAETSGATGNVDGTDATEAITNPDGDSFTYKAEFPFSDDHSGTLADVAMYYWKNDLMPSLDNNVPPSDINSAFWQHMSVFGVGFGVVGQVDPDDAFAAIESPEDYSFSWPEPSSRSPSTVDDLLHASVNSRGGYFSASRPQEFADRLSGVLRSILARTEGSASTVAANSTRLGTETRVFQASFNTDGWTGEVQAWGLNEDGTVKPDAEWSTMGRIRPAAYAVRDVFSYNGETGIRFTADEWVNMNAQQQVALIGEDDASRAFERIDWVRGRSDVAGLRERDDLLGDIVNSSPVIASNRNFRFSALPEELGGETYDAFVVDKKEGRRDVLYVGANDGMLHAFDAESGEELFAYIPSMVYEQLHDMSLPDYGEPGDNSHRYSVDGPLFVGDAYFTHNGTTEWRNILIGTLGAGGRGVFVLDVTDPTSFDQSDILFEITDDDFSQLGNVLGEPVVAPTVEGWRIIFGNGYNSDEGASALFVVDLDDPTGADTMVLETDEVDNNGLATPALLVNANGMVTHAYAGDLQGRLWKFGLSGNTNNWGVSYGNRNNPTPLFTARDPDGQVQAITSAPTLGSNAQIDDAVMVYFGTGRYLSLSDNRPGDTVQSVYAIADTGRAISSTDRRTLMEKRIVGESIIETGDNEGRMRREVSNNHDTGWWSDKDGWYMDLQYTAEGADSVVTGERVVSQPMLIYDRLIFPTLLTNDDPCSPGSHGWLMELVAVGDRYDDHSILGEDGMSLDSAVMALSEIIRGGEKVYIPTSNIEGGIDVETGSLPAEVVGRQSWRQLQ